MKSFLTAAAFALMLASPALAEDGTGTETLSAPAVLEIVPAATEPAAGETPAAAAEDAAQSMPAMGGHGCGSRKTVYLTN